MKEEEKTSPVQPVPEDDYLKIIKSEVEVDKKFIEEDGQSAKIVYYCRDCKSAVSPTRVGKKLSFKCATCGRDVSFGTETSIHNYYNVKQKQN